MKVFTALLDTSILWPSLQRDLLLSLAAEGLYRPVWSAVILEELEYREAQRLVEHGAEPAEAAERARLLIEHLQTAFDDSLVEGWEDLAGANPLPHPYDEHVVLAAVADGADAIVTHNVKDFPPDRLPPHLSVLKPAEFLLSTVSRDPHRALGAVTEIARRSGRQGSALSVSETLALLAWNYGLDDTVEVLRGSTRRRGRTGEPSTPSTRQSREPALAVLDADIGRRALASAAFRGDGTAIVEILTGRTPGMLLQHAGIALMVALADHVDGAENLAPQLVESLRAREYDGDDVLAEQLIAATAGPPTGRRAVPVDLDMLADLLEGDPSDDSGGYLDLATGRAWPDASLEDVPGDALDLEDDRRWLRVDTLGSRDAWRDMRGFADALAVNPLAQRLGEAIEGPGAFSRFRVELAQHPDQVPGWLAFRDERRVGRARGWLADHGYDALAQSGH